MACSASCLSHPLCARNAPSMSVSRSKRSHGRLTRTAANRTCPHPKTLARNLRQNSRGQGGQLSTVDAMHAEDTTGLFLKDCSSTCNVSFMLEIIQVADVWHVLINAFWMYVRFWSLTKLILGLFTRCCKTRGQIMAARCTRWIHKLWGRFDVRSKPRHLLIQKSVACGMCSFAQTALPAQLRNWKYDWIRLLGKATCQATSTKKFKFKYGSPFTENLQVSEIKTDWICLQGRGCDMLWRAANTAMCDELWLQSHEAAKFGEFLEMQRGNLVQLSMSLY